MLATNSALTLGMHHSFFCHSQDDCKVFPHSGICSRPAIPANAGIQFLLYMRVKVGMRMKVLSHIPSYFGGSYGSTVGGLVCNPIPRVGPGNGC